MFSLRYILGSKISLLMFVFVFTDIFYLIKFLNNFFATDSNFRKRFNMTS